MPGADDYITKPFDTEVLLCKIQAIIKRQSVETPPDRPFFTIGSYEFDARLRTISRDHEQQKLSPKEADLLKLLCQNKNELLSRETALRKIWGDDGYFTARSMDVLYHQTPEIPERRPQHRNPQHSRKRVYAGGEIVIIPSLFLFQNF